MCVSVPTHILDTAFVLMLYKREFDNTFLVDTNAAYTFAPLYSASKRNHNCISPAGATDVRGGPRQEEFDIIEKPVCPNCRRDLF